MKLVNSWVGRRMAQTLATLVIASTCHAAVSLDQTAESQTEPPAQVGDSSVSGQTAPAPVVRQTQPPPAQTTTPPLPPTSVQPPSAMPAQTQEVPKDQQFTGDQQYTTPAATQQLTPLKAREPATAPATATQPTTPLPTPVGTAVAPVINAKGTAGSRVAGAAVAPAKQRRIRTFAIRAALVAGAAVAIGVVVGASKASPARAQ